MSRSVSAPSSVTNTSPCWNGLIVPGSTLRYGSNFWSWTRRPRALSSRPSDAATIPFPRAETTPPVTKTYFGARALTGFQSSSGDGWSLCRRRTDERGEPRQRLRREVAADSAEARRLDGEGGLRPVVVRRELEHGADPLAHELERDPLQRNDLEHEKIAPNHRLTPEGHAARAPALDAPDGARSEGAPDHGLDRADPRPPVREALRLGEHRPHVLDGRRQDAPSHVLRQGTPVHRASARAPPSARRRRAARS